MRCRGDADRAAKAEALRQHLELPQERSQRATNLVADELSDRRLEVVLAGGEAAPLGLPTRRS
jgi:hypothetical protein